MENAYAWAAEEFGTARLGDVRRTARLVEMAATCVQRPTGLVTRTMLNPAEREAAYRFLESRSIDNAAIADSMYAASARRCRSTPRIIVPIDQSTVSFVDRQASKQLGRTGTISHNAMRRGFEVMSALAVLPNGVNAGLLAQEWHIRSDERAPARRHDPRPFEERESSLWPRCIVSLARVLREHAPGVRPWLQMDRGADMSQVLLTATELDLDFTVRSQSNRSLSPLGYMRNVVRNSRPLGSTSLELLDSHAPAGSPRRRMARFAVRARRLPIRLQTPRGKFIATLRLTVVHIRESCQRRNPIEWYLLTNREATTLPQALEIVRAYRCRWIVEEFHRAWKDGGTGVENSQLRSAHALRRWATILAAVATRAERLKTTSRTTPDACAMTEFTRDELDAAILLSRQCSYKPGDSLTLEQAVELVARLGGFTGRRNAGGPPGVTVIGRGLHDVGVAASVLAAQRRSG
jgi:hypothetical protein